MRFRVLPGFRDFYPEQLAVRRGIEAAWHRASRAAGFQVRSQFRSWSRLPRSHSRSARGGRQGYCTSGRVVLVRLLFGDRRAEELVDFLVDGVRIESSIPLPYQTSGDAQGHARGTELRLADRAFRLFENS